MVQSLRCIRNRLGRCIPHRLRRMGTPVVDSLHYYPIKACGGVTVDRTEVLPTGLEHDRTFTVIGDDGVCRTQREHRVLAAVRVAVLDGGERLELRAPSLEPLELSVQFDGKRMPLTVFRHSGDGVDQGDDVAEWFSTLLGEPCRLARIPPDHQRVAGGETPGTTGFADGQAITVASLSSLDDLNDRILERGGEPVPVSRFRPNIVVAGWPEPYTEDRVRRMRIGGAQFGYAKRDIRCVVTLVDQDTGGRGGPEPIRTLATYRRDPDDGGVSFAMKANVVAGGSIAVRDAVGVQGWGPGLAGF